MPSRHDCLVRLVQVRSSKLAACVAQPLVQHRLSPPPRISVMKRRFVDVVRAWVKLTPSLLRVAIRRGRHLRPSRRTDSRTARPLVVDRREVGTISSHDDVGTSTAEIRAMLVDEIDAAAAQSVINSVTSEAFARGNHRAAWTVCESQLALVSALQSQGFTPEGLAAPPLGDTR